mgnify:FL=1
MFGNGHKLIVQNSKLWSGTGETLVKEEGLESVVSVHWDRIVLGSAVVREQMELVVEGFDYLVEVAVGACLLAYFGYLLDELVLAVLRG